MTRDDLLARLLAIAQRPIDVEADHADADQALIEFINDSEITAAFEAIEKWYA